MPRGIVRSLRLCDLTILWVSENSSAWFGCPPDQLLDQPVAKILGLEGEALLRDVVAREPVDRNPLYLFTLPSPVGGEPLNVSVHTIDGVVVLEFEATGRGEGQQSEPDYYALVKKSVVRLQGAKTLKEFCQVVTEEVRALTALDRVMVYKFHADAHGEVIAESRRADLPSWLGLHYPAEDIPKPAREVFKKIWIRPLPDAKAPVMELVPLANPDTGKPLTMTHCALRGASVMYTEYLQNMRVAASLTMPILREGELWGLIACHHYTATRFPYQVRAAAEFLAQVVSLQLKSAEDREHYLYQLKMEGVHSQLIAVAAQEGGLVAMTDGKPNLLDGMDVGGAALYHRDRWWRVGRTPTEAQLEALNIWLDTRHEFDSPTRPVYVTDSLSRDYPEGDAFADVGSGVLAVPLSRTRKNLMIWFRPETIQTVNWAGNPHDKPTVPGPHGPRLTPRTSFELFVESVQQRSFPWGTVEIEAALHLRVLVMELVVSRAERLASLNADLARSNEELDAFAYVASHDLKEPLRGISKYAHQLLEDAQSLSAEHRTKLEGLMRLTLRMDSLLDSLLHFSRVGRAGLELKETNLNEVLEEALEIVAARQEEAHTDMVIPRPLPTAQCDRIRVREIFTNLLSNALKYNNKPRRRIEVGFFAPGESGECPNAPQECQRHTIYYVRDNGIGIDQRHYAQVFAMFKRLHGRTEYGGGAGAGLAIVKKLVERHRGCVWLDSALGEGSTFFFTLPCQKGGQ
ncbi:MAG: GAF domain-containing protein [Verrucomicrobiota bacterium]